MNEEQMDQKRFEDLAAQSAGRGIFTFSDFLTPAQQDILLRGKYPVPASLYGGADGCERAVARFGDPEDLGYEEPYPIVILEMEPKSAKFADRLTHRDVLGALMNLGIKRQVLGDIVIHGDRIYLFCLEKIADHITSELKRAKHTDLVIKRVDALPEGAAFTLDEITVQCASQRVDALISKVFNLSRSDAAALFEAQKVFVNSRICEDGSRTCRDGDVISARGYG